MIVTISHIGDFSVSHLGSSDLTLTVPATLPRSALTDSRIKSKGKMMYKMTMTLLAHESVCVGKLSRT